MYRRLTPLIVVVIMIITSLLSACIADNPVVSPTELPTQSPVTPQPSTQPIFLFFIYLEDDGRTGKQVGCGDSVVPVAWDIPPTTDPVGAALKALFSLDDQYTGQEQLYNSLYQSDLIVEKITINGEGKAIIDLSGSYQLGGVCDNPRFEAQITETVLQFPEINSVEIYINTIPLSEILSGK